MPLASGSPTQNSTVFSSTTELSATSTTSFKDGDGATVQVASSTTALLYLLNTRLADVPDGVNIVATKESQSGLFPGRWCLTASIPSSSMSPSGGFVVFAPGLPTSDNVYDTFENAYRACAKGNSIVCDGRFATPASPFEIGPPGAVYDMRLRNLLGNNIVEFSGSPPPVLTVLDRVKLDGLRNVGQTLILSSKSTESVVSLSSTTATRGDLLILSEGGRVQSEVGFAPFIEVLPSRFGAIALDFGGQVGDGTTEAVAIGAGATLAIVVGSQATLPSNAVTGPSSAQLNLQVGDDSSTFDLLQPLFTGVVNTQYIAQAANQTYSTLAFDDLWNDPSPAKLTQNALDSLVARTSIFVYRPGPPAASNNNVYTDITKLFNALSSVQGSKTVLLVAGASGAVTFAPGSYTVVPDTTFVGFSDGFNMVPVEFGDGAGGDVSFDVGNGTTFANVAILHRNISKPALVTSTGKVPFVRFVSQGSISSQALAAPIAAIDIGVSGSALTSALQFEGDWKIFVGSPNRPIVSSASGPVNVLSIGRFAAFDNSLFAPPTPTANILALSVSGLSNISSFQNPLIHSPPLASDSILVTYEGVVIVGFTSASLNASNELSVAHNLKTRCPKISVTNGANVIFPVGYTKAIVVDDNTVLIDFTSQLPIVGTWAVSITR